MESPKKKPLIVHVVRQFLPNRGGLEDVVANLSLELLKRDYRVRVVTLDRLFIQPDKILPSSETLDGIEIVRIPWRGSSRYPLAPTVFKYLGDADIIHVHAIDFFFDALAWGWLLHRKPMVVTTHGGFFHTTAHSKIKTLWFNTITRISALAYQDIIACSKADERLFEQIAKRRTVLIENAAGIEKFANSASTTAQQRLITIGRFSVNKQPGNLLETLAMLAKGGPDWQLDICGVPSDLTELDLQEHAASLGIKDQVHIHVGASNETIRDLMKEASFFVSASEYEGFGLVAIEAMSAGLIPILQPNDAYRDLASAHSFIRLADFRLPDQAATTIREAFQDLRNRPELRDLAIKTAKAYSWESAAGRYATIYDEIVRAA